MAMGTSPSIVHLAILRKRELLLCGEVLLRSSHLHHFGGLNDWHGDCQGVSSCGSVGSFSQNEAQRCSEHKKHDNASAEFDEQQVLGRGQAHWVHKS